MTTIFRTLIASVALLGCMAASAQSAAGNSNPPPACAECGQVRSIEMQERPGRSSALGTLAGGALGAVLGRQIGDGLGRDVAGIAGAVGGAYVGREIEKWARSQPVWLVGVQFGNGSQTSAQATFEFAQEPDFRVGDVVRRSGASIERR
jgi:outer membrane lipoprotein SlyB